MTPRKPRKPDPEHDIRVDKFDHPIRTEPYTDLDLGDPEAIEAYLKKHREKG